MEDHALLTLPHLVVVSGEPDFELQRIARTVRHSVTVDGRRGLEQLLGRLAAAADGAVGSRTLDLVGHTRRASLLMLGDWMIDGGDPATKRWFRALAEGGVLARLGIRALRLLGCNTAATPRGRATICELAEALGIDPTGGAAPGPAGRAVGVPTPRDLASPIEVLGSTQLLHAGHYDAGGFRACWSFLLVAASALRAREACPPPRHPHPRVLEVEALPAIALGAFAARSPRHLADPAAAREILGLVRRREGARLLGATPGCELALPAAALHAYHIADVLLDGEFLQFYPDGMTASGIAFPVEDAGALRRVVAALPPTCAV
jgi:hypothetical protein